MTRCRFEKKRSDFSGSGSICRFSCSCLCGMGEMPGGREGCMSPGWRGLRRELGSLTSSSNDAPRPEFDPQRRKPAPKNGCHAPCAWFSGASIPLHPTVIRQPSTSWTTQSVHPSAASDRATCACQAASPHATFPRFQELAVARALGRLIHAEACLMHAAIASRACRRGKHGKGGCGPDHHWTTGIVSGEIHHHKRHQTPDE